MNAAELWLLLRAAAQAEVFVQIEIETEVMRGFVELIYFIIVQNASWSNACLELTLIKLLANESIW